MSFLQSQKQELLELGSSGQAKGTPGGNQDIRLGQLLQESIDAVTDKFISITLEDTTTERRKS
jgi:hypothetical protein